MTETKKSKRKGKQKHSKTRSLFAHQRPPRRPKHFLNTSLLTTIALLLLQAHPTLTESLYIQTQEYSFKSSKLGRFIPFSFSNSLNIGQTTPNQKYQYINQFILKSSQTKEVIRFFENFKLDLEITSLYNVSVVENKYFAEEFASFIAKIHPKQSLEPWNGCIFFETTPYQHTNLSDSGSFIKTGPGPSLSSSDNCKPLSMSGQWVPSFNFGTYAWLLFSTIKLVMNLAALGVTFGRPFLPKWAKLRAIWVSQVVIYWQLYMYIGLCPGLFGGVVDQIQEEALHASNRYLYLIRSRKADLAHLTRISTYPIYKYYLNEVLPSLTDDLLIESSALLIAILADFVLGIWGSKKSKIVCQEIKSGITQFVMVPMLVYIPVVIFVYARIGYLENFEGFFNFALAVFFGSYYLVRLTKMALYISEMKYLYNKRVFQLGKADFEYGSDLALDTYPSINTNGWVRTAEHCVYIVLILSNVVFFDLRGFSVVIWVLGWGGLAGLQLAKVDDSELIRCPDKKSARLTAWLNTSVCVLMAVLSLILAVLSILSFLGLIFIQILTFGYIVLSLALIGTLVGALVVRGLDLRTEPEYVRLEREGRKRAKRMSAYNLVMKGDEEGDGGGGDNGKAVELGEGGLKK